MKSLKFLPLSFIVLAVSGCGLMFGGSTKTITVTSNPPGAQLTTNPVSGTFSTPSSIELDRKNNYTLVASLAGYSDSQMFLKKKVRGGILVLDILMGGIWVVVDFVTGAIYDLDPDNVNMTLSKVDPTVDGPDTITVSFGVEGGKRGSLTLTPHSTVEGVRILVIPR